MNPEVPFSAALEKILNKLKSLPEVCNFPSCVEVVSFNLTYISGTFAASVCPISEACPSQASTRLLHNH